MNSFRGENIRNNVRWLSGSVHVAGTPEQLSLMDQLEDKVSTEERLVYLAVVPKI